MASADGHDGLHDGFSDGLGAPPPPPGLPPQPVPAGHGPHTAIVITITGLFAGATMPPAVELLAEDQLLAEGTSANAVMLAVQFFAVTNT